MWVTLTALVLLLITGTVGYHLIEQFSLLDALYQTVITVTTVGFGEVQPLSPPGRIFTLFLILFGLGTVTYGLSQIARWTLELKLGELLGRRSIRTVKRLRGHYIICGHGRVGSAAAERLLMERVPFVVIEKDPEQAEILKEKKYSFVIGDATDEEVLRTAGILHAKGLAALLPSDADNLYLVMTARVLNPELIIVARALTEEAERKLYRAGANEVIAPYRVSGYRIALHLVNPALMDFVDLALVKKNLELEMREYAVQPDSPIQGHSLEGLELRKRANVVVVALKREGEMIINPDPTLVFQPGDVLIVLGEKKMLEKFVESFL